MNKPLHRNRCFLICGFLILATLVVYWPVLKHDFVKYDDDKYVTENPRIKGGITAESVVRAFTIPHYHMWHYRRALQINPDYTKARQRLEAALATQKNRQ